MQVPLGIIPHSEISYEDMVAVMEELHKYVPTVSTTESVMVAGSEEEDTVHLDTFHYLLFGGDQLTAARARGGLRTRENSQRPRHRLEGLQSVCEDWHAKAILLEVGA